MTLSVVVTVDVDNDGVSLTNERDRLSWNGLALIPQVAEIIREFGLPVTWFIRADSQLQEYYGAVDFLLTEHRSLWASLARAGDEIGWHPHIYAPAAGGYLPVRDEQAVAQALRVTNAELSARGHAFASVRMGEAIGGNTILRTLAELGLRVDSSAIPGRRRIDRDRWFDWSTSPNRPYWPSAADYRVPGVPTLPILEVPMTATLVHAPFDPCPLPRYTNLAYHPPIFAAALERWFGGPAERSEHAVLTLIVHPDELMARTGDHPLYAFAPQALRINLKTTLDMARQRHINVIGATTSHIIESSTRERST